MLHLDKIDENLLEDQKLNWLHNDNHGEAIMFGWLSIKLIKNPRFLPFFTYACTMYILDIYYTFMYVYQIYKTFEDFICISNLILVFHVRVYVILLSDFKLHLGFLVIFWIH